MFGIYVVPGLNLCHEENYCKALKQCQMHSFDMKRIAFSHGVEPKAELSIASHCICLPVVLFFPYFTCSSALISVMLNYQSLKLQFMAVLTKCFNIS